MTPNLVLWWPWKRLACWSVEAKAYCAGSKPKAPILECQDLFIVVFWKGFLGLWSGHHELKDTCHLVGPRCIFCRCFTTIWPSLAARFRKHDFEWGNVPFWDSMWNSESVEHGAAFRSHPGFLQLRESVNLWPLVLSIHGYSYNAPTLPFRCLKLFSG